MKMKTIKPASVFKLFVLILNFTFCVMNFPLYAQDSSKLSDLTKRVIEAKPEDDLLPVFEELQGIYFKDNKFVEFIELLKSLSQKKKSAAPFADYFIASSRYYQMKHLEEAQEWDEYFAEGNAYRDQIASSAKKAIDATSGSKDAVNVYARLLLWRFHKDQQDVFTDTSMEELMSSVSEYSKGAGGHSVLKSVADELLAYGEKGKAREVYKLYVDQLVKSQATKEELKAIGRDFYRQGNLELSESIFDAYLDKLQISQGKEAVLPELAQLAQDFSYNDGTPNDPDYAEKMFKKIEGLAGAGFFNEGLIYLRAFNLERSKELIAAKDLYVELVKRFPDTRYLQEAYYKIAIISTYISANPQEGRGYFTKLSEKEPVSPESISSLYQLGLLNQWEGDITKARSYYNKLLEKAKDGFKDTVELAKERLLEIKEKKPIEYNLKKFLDIALKEEYSSLEKAATNLKALPAKAKAALSQVNVNSSLYTGSTGCMPVEYQYLWSGNTGDTKPKNEIGSFGTRYGAPGTKEINLVVVSPTGIAGIDLEMVLVD